MLKTVVSRTNILQLSDRLSKLGLVRKISQCGADGGQSVPIIPFGAISAQWANTQTLTKCKSSSVGVDVSSEFDNLTSRFGLSARITPVSEIGTSLPVVPIQMPLRVHSPLTYKEENPKDKKKPMEDPLINPRGVIEEDPSTSTPIEKQANRMIRIRKLKMNKHKRKKLAKRMKFVWERQDLKRNTTKEKAFLDGLVAKIQKAEKFNAKEFVAQCVARANEEPLPRRLLDPLMPEWYRNEMIADQSFNKHFSKIVNVNLNQPIQIRPYKEVRTLREKEKKSPK